MITNLSIKKKLLIYSFFIQLIVLSIFSFSLYKALEISTFDKLQATLKVIILDVTDDILEHDKISQKILDENKEYKFEPLFIKIMDSNSHDTILQTTNYPQNIKHDDTLLKNIQKDIITFEEQNNYLISRIKVDFHNLQEIIIEVSTTKELLNSTLEELVYILMFILPIILIFSILGGNFIIYKSFLPIEKILIQLKNINAKDLSTRIKNNKSADEINNLIFEINSLLGRLEDSFERISQFSSDASHELKTPLTIIKGELEIALRKDRDISEYKKVLNSCINEVNIIEETINDLLFLAKNEKDLLIDKMNLFYFDEIIDESINELKNLANINKINFEIDLNETIEYKGYGNLLKIAIKNILKNAIQYSFENGKISITTKINKDRFEISIKDYGIGIEKNKQEKIFEKFYRTDSSRDKNSGGVGLGMSIVKKIIDIHKGNIYINSEKNNGTLIVISLKI